MLYHLLGVVYYWMLLIEAGPPGVHLGGFEILCLSAESGSAGIIPRLSLHESQQMCSLV